MTHVAGHDRSQKLLLPESLDDYVGPENHPFQGDMVSPVLSDDGSIDKVWIGMAGRFGSV
jgi:hypothetical protein